MDTVHRLAQTGERGQTLNRQLKDKLLEHKQFIRKNGRHMPEIRDWQWPAAH